MLNRFIICSMLILSAVSKIGAQSEYTLDRAISDAISHAPSYKMNGILTSERDLAIKNLNSKYLPQFGLSAQATYQSETTGLDLNVPGFTIDRLSRDQYKAVLDVNQVLYDGGSIGISKKMKNTALAIEQESSNIDIEQLREQIIQIYFVILELERRITILEYKDEDISANLKKLETAVNAGVVLKSTLKDLMAEKLSLDQKRIELTSIKEIQIKYLSILTGNNELKTTSFVLPIDVTSSASQIENKPMMKFLSLSQMQAMNAKELDQLLSRPKAGLFVQGGYGKPGLNFLKNEFTPYYIAGMRIQWNLNNLYTRSKDAQISQLQVQKIDIKKQSYEQQLDMKIQTVELDINRYKLLLEKDKELIRLRKEIKQTAGARLTSGAITSGDYLLELNAENEAQLNEEIHKILLLKASYLLQLHKGNYSKN